jgi:predicted TIM-barrel fold metal-dependent hydrolase
MEPKIFDINGFVGPWPYWPVTHNTPEAILSLMDRYQIETLAVCSTRSIFKDWRQGNEETITLAERFPARFIPIISISPILPVPDLVRRLKDYKHRKVKGIRLYPQHQGYSLTMNSSMAEVLKTAQEIHLPVFLSIRTIMNWGLPELTPSDIEATVLRYPDLHIVLSGINYDTNLWSYDLMQRCPNVDLEISGLQGFRAVDHAVQVLGSSRVLFGSGLPLLYPACSLVKLESAKISQEQRRAVVESNARRVLQI